MIKHTYGYGKPVIGIIACLHGDETCGLAAFASLAGEKLKGTVKCVIGNPGAMAENRRFLTRDLNKSFPGNAEGDYEDQQAAQVMSELANCQYVLDLHSCSQPFPFAIATCRTKNHLRLAQACGLGTVVLMSTHLKGGKALIDHHPCAISIECGTKGTAQCDRQAAVCVTNILRALGVMEGQAGPVGALAAFEIVGRMQLPDDSFVPSNSIQDFVLVKQGTLLGTSDLLRLTVKTDFVPVFFGEPAYLQEGTLGLIARTTTWG